MFVEHFDANSIINYTLEIDNYYDGTGKSIFARSLNYSTNITDGTIDYNSTTKQLKVCFTDVIGEEVFTHLYLTWSRAYVTMYYTFAQNGTNLSDIVQLYKGDTVNYQFATVPLIYKEMNVVIMPNYVALQINLDPEKEDIRVQYNKHLQGDHPDHTALKQILIYCQENWNNQITVYTHNNINFINAS